MDRIRIVEAFQQPYDELLYSWLADFWWAVGTWARTDGKGEVVFFTKAVDLRKLK
jgi:hypothetical protein